MANLLIQSSYWENEDIHIRKVLGRFDNVDDAILSAVPSAFELYTRISAETNNYDANRFIHYNCNWFVEINCSAVGDHPFEFDDLLFPDDITCMRPYGYVKNVDITTDVYTNFIKLVNTLCAYSYAWTVTTYF